MFIYARKSVIAPVRRSIRPQIQYFPVSVCRQDKIAPPSPGGTHEIIPGNIYTNAKVPYRPDIFPWKIIPVRTPFLQAGKDGRLCLNKHYLFVQLCRLSMLFSGMHIKNLLRAA